MTTIQHPQRLSFTLILVGVLVAVSGCSFKSKTDSLNTLHLVSIAKIKGLDPVTTGDDFYASVEMGRVYESLLQYHYLKRPFTLIPGLAEAMPEVSQDGKTVRVRLKKGVLFQDDPCFKVTNGRGRELVADDVVYSFKRIADPKIGAEAWWIFDGKIVGMNEWRDAALKAGSVDYGKEISGLRAVDPYTVEIHLTQRSALFLYNLAMTKTAIVPREAVEYYGKEIINHPVGTGPFRLKEIVPGSKLVWVKNPTYRKDLYPSEGAPGDREAGLLDDAGKPLPFVDGIVVQIIEEQQPMWLNFLAGKLDVSGIPKDNYTQAIGPGKDLTPELKAKGIRLNKYDLLDVTHTSFNMADPILGKNKLLRQAMSLASDETTLIELFYNGRAIPAQGPIPPGLAGYDPAFKNPYRQYNLAKAKEYLARAGYPGGKGLPEFEYLTLTDSTSRQMAEYFQKQMTALGIKLRVTGSSWPEFTTAMKNKRGQIYSFAWSGDYPDAENFLALFYGKNVSPGSNDANYVNPEFDRLYEQALKLTDSPQRTALYKKMVAIVVEDCPWIFGVHRLGFALTQGWLKNFKYSDVDMTRAKYLRLDKGEGKSTGK